MSYYRTSINDIMHPKGGPKVSDDLQYKSLEALEMLIEKVDDLYSRPAIKFDDIKDFIIQYIVPPQELQYPAAPSSASSGTRNTSSPGKLSMDSSLSDWIPTLAISISIINIIAILIVAVVIVIILLSRPASRKRG